MLVGVVFAFAESDELRDRHVDRREAPSGRRLFLVGLFIELTPGAGPARCVGSVPQGGLTGYRLAFFRNAFRNTPLTEQSPLLSMNKMTMSKPLW